jgi:hypothetical protein
MIIDLCSDEEEAVPPICKEREKQHKIVVGRGVKRADADVEEILQKETSQSRRTKRDEGESEGSQENRIFREFFSENRNGNFVGADDDDFALPLQEISHSQLQRWNNETDNDENSYSQNENTSQKKRRNKVSAEEARAVKLRAKLQSQQKYGFYKHQELSLILEEKLFQSELGGEIASHLLFSSSSGSQKSYGYSSMKSAIPGLCQWTYRSYLDGGHGSIGEVGVQLLPIVVIVYSSQKLIQLALNNAHNDDLSFSEYSREVQAIRSHLTPLYRTQQGGQQKIKIILTLIGIHEECVIFQRNQGRARANANLPPITQRLDELLAYSLYVEDVEICCRKNSAEFCSYLESLTRVLGDQLYSVEKTTLETFKRLPFCLFVPLLINCLTLRLPMRSVDPTVTFTPAQKIEHEVPIPPSPLPCSPLSV